MSAAPEPRPETLLFMGVVPETGLRGRIYDGTGERLCDSQSERGTYCYGPTGHSGDHSCSDTGERWTR